MSILGAPRLASLEPLGPSNVPQLPHATSAHSQHPSTANPSHSSQTEIAHLLAKAPHENPRRPPPLFRHAPNRPPTHKRRPPPPPSTRPPRPSPLDTRPEPAALKDDTAAARLLALRPPLRGQGAGQVDRDVRGRGAVGWGVPRAVGLLPRSHLHQIRGSAGYAGRC